MELVREYWTQKDIPEFQEYLLSFSKGDFKSMWEQRIVNTKLPCIAVPSPVIKKFVKEIAKGNFLEFLNLNIMENYANTTINGGLICKIKDFDLMKKYLDRCIKKVDNWGSVDSLKFKIDNDNRDKFFDLAKEYVKSDLTFVRRCGLVILLKMLNEEYIDEIFEIMNSLTDEKEYYVNMINAWLFSECFVKFREKTLEFLKDNKLNDFTINKGIQKCRDSFRVSQEDKEMLLQFKRGKNGNKKS